MLLKVTTASFLARCRVGRQREAEEWLESDKESDGGLCEVGNLVEVQAARREIRNLVDQPSIFRADAEVMRHIEIDAAAVHERRLRLAGDSARGGFVCR